MDDLNARTCNTQGAKGVNESRCLTRAGANGDRGDDGLTRRGVNPLTLLPSVPLVRYALLPSSEITTPSGPFPTVTVAVTVLVEVSITETVFEP